MSDPTGGSRAGATRFRPGQARWVSARTGETPLRESGKAAEREVFPAVEEVLCVAQGLAAGLDGDDFPEGSHRAAAVPGAVASREGSLERMRRHLRWTDVAVTGFRRARPARILQRRALGPGFCRTKPCGRHGRFPVFLRNFKAGLRSRAMDTEASGAPAVICGTAEFPETRVEMPAPDGPGRLCPSRFCDRPSTLRSDSGGPGSGARPHDRPRGLS